MPRNENNLIFERYINKLNESQSTTEKKVDVKVLTEKLQPIVTSFQSGSKPSTEDVALYTEAMKSLLPLKTEELRETWKSLLKETQNTITDKQAFMEFLQWILQEKQTGSVGDEIRLGLQRIKQDTTNKNTLVLESKKKDKKKEKKDKSKDKEKKLPPWLMKKPKK